MKVALVADIHSNLHALEAGLAVIRGHGVDLIACAGDIVGYGAFPNECCHIVEDECDHVIRGNHDRAALSKDFSGMNPYAAAAALWTSDELNDRSRSFLEGLSESAEFGPVDQRFAMFHGSPQDPDEYVYEESVGRWMIERSACKYLVLGHTHMPYIRSLENGVAINPGSIGQPRDRDPRGSIALVDTEERDGAKNIRFDYPIEEAADAIASKGLPNILGERLHIGW